LDVLDCDEFTALLHELRVCELVVVLEDRASVSLILFEAQVGLTKARGVGLSAQSVVVDVDQAILVEVGIHHAIAIHISKLHHWRTVFIIPGEEVLVLVVDSQTEELLPVDIPRQVNLVVVLPVLVSRLLHEDVGHAVTIQVEERGGVRRRHVVVQVRLDTRVVILGLNQEICEVLSFELLRVIVVSEKDFHVEIDVIEDDVGLQVSIDVEESRLSVVSNLILALALETGLIQLEGALLWLLEHFDESLLPVSIWFVDHVEALQLLHVLSGHNIGDHQLVVVWLDHLRRCTNLLIGLVLWIVVVDNKRVLVVVQGDEVRVSVAVHVSQSHELHPIDTHGLLIQAETRFIEAFGWSFPEETRVELLQRWDLVLSS